MAIDPNIKQKAENIRLKKKGREVRESLAAGLESMSEDVVETVDRQDYVEQQLQAVHDSTRGKDVISATEILASQVGADGTKYNNMKERLDAEQNKVNAQLAQNKLNDEQLRALVELLQNQVTNMGDISPEPYGTYTDLVNANPAHSGVYVVAENGYWYYWNSIDNRWSAGGVYMETAIAEKGVKPSNLATTDNSSRLDFSGKYNVPSRTTSLYIKDEPLKAGKVNLVGKFGASDNHTFFLLEKLSSGVFRAKQKVVKKLTVGIHEVITGFEAVGDGNEYLGVIGQIYYDNETAGRMYEKQASNPGALLFYAPVSPNTTSALGFYPLYTDEKMTKKNMESIEHLDHQLKRYTEIEISYPNNISYNIEGSTKQYTGWYSSNNQNCTNYRKIKVSLPYYLNGNVNVSGIVFFNDAGMPIASYQGDQQTPEKYLFIEKEIEVPEGASYFIASQYNDGNLISNNQISVELKDAVYDLNKLAGDPITRLDVLNAGDSLTEGDYGSNPAGTKNVKPENYPYFLQKYLGCKVDNKGKSGYTATAWWVNMAQTIDYTQHDIMLIMLGTNGGLTDTLVEDTTITDGQTYLDYADTNTGDYCKIIEHAMDQNKALQIILLTPPHVGDMRPLNKTNAQNAKPVVYKIAERYKLPVIDMDKAGFNDYNQSFFQPIDQLHFGLEGYKRMGTYIGSQIKSLASFTKI